MRFARLVARDAFWGLAVAICASSAAVADEPVAAGDPATLQEVRQAIVALDRDSFAERGRAAGRLQQLIDSARLNGLLAREFSRALLRDETSPEARARLDEFLTQLGSPAVDDTPPAAASDIPLLLARLNDDSCAVRDTAERRLASLLGHVDLIAPLLVELKRSLAEENLRAHHRRALEPLLEKTRAAWLAADPARVPLPPIPPETIEDWIMALAPRPEFTISPYRQAVAHRELLDAIARDDTRDMALKMLEARISGSGEAAAAGDLRQIADFSKPAMAAEVWQNHVNLFVQYLIIGVPQYNTMTMRPTHFDRIDDKKAHCLSGNSLLPGDYPVRVAIPHPEPGRDLMFYLTNLPTPRHRLAYEFQVRRDETSRLAEISRSTLDDILESKRMLDEGQILLLEQLDAAAVSRFAGPYFQVAANAPLATLSNELVGQSTTFGGVCHVLARVGTHEAVPALEQIARSGKLGDPTYESPARIAWIAALAIAQRDAWDGIDAWLARLVEEKVPLVTNLDPSPELGATAAATLLERHGASPHAFGLETVGESLAERFRLAGYRFDTEADRAAVLIWWQRQSTDAEHTAP